MKQLGQILKSAKTMRDIKAVRYTNPQTKNQSTPTSYYNVNPNNPLANAVAGMAVAKANPSAFDNGPIKMNNSNQTGRVIS
jgi:hypothetical protein